MPYPTPQAIGALWPPNRAGVGGPRRWRLRSGACRSLRVRHDGAFGSILGRSTLGQRLCTGLCTGRVRGCHRRGRRRGELRGLVVRHIRTDVTVLLNGSDELMPAAGFEGKLRELRSQRTGVLIRFC